ncbi:MAG: metalloprotease PmbA [Pseudomonadales bacterium]|nr:metalloprotease PmbA [Pseudomonadales bacterium]
MSDRHAPALSAERLGVGGAGRRLLQDRAAEVLALAKAAGATAAEVSLARRQALELTVRQGDLETLGQTEGQDLSLTVFSGQRSASVSSSDLSSSACATLVEKALFLAKEAEEDPYAGLAPPELAPGVLPDLGLFEPWPLTLAEAKTLAEACEAAALAVSPELRNSEGATVASALGLSCYANSQGFVAVQPRSRHGLYAAVIAGEGSRMQRDGWGLTLRRPDERLSADAIGRRAGERALARLDARTVPTGRYPVVFESSVAGSLLGHFIGAISGGALYRRASFLCDALGEALFPERYQIMEDPLRSGALASASFDDDAVATAPKAFVESGRLVSYALSVYAARRLGLAPTGNGGGVHNLSMNHDGLSRAELLETLGTGLWITELMGQGVNGVTGDYSRGAAGFWVENGKLAYPVQEITVAGNLRAMFKQIRAVADDVERPGAVEVGSLLVDGLTLAGA